MLNETIASCGAFSTIFYQEFVTDQVILEKLFWSWRRLVFMDFGLILVSDLFLL